MGRVEKRFIYVFFYFFRYGFGYYDVVEEGDENEVERVYEAGVSGLSEFGIVVVV